MTCVFCDIKEESVFLENDHATAFFDKYPVSNGHVLIIPKQHFESYFDIPDKIKINMLKLMDEAKNELEKSYSPDGFNIGINVGAAAGQTVFHCHIHLIPRYSNDMKNPEGGVRGVIPEKQKY